MVRVYIDGLTPSRKASTHIPKLVRRLTPALSAPSPRQSRCDDQLCSDAPAPYVTFGYPNLKTVKELIYKRGYGKVRRSFCRSLQDMQAL